MPPANQLYPTSSPSVPVAPIPPGRTRAPIGFTEARVAAEQAGVRQQHQAARRVAEHSRDVDDCREMLLMLGLSGVAPRKAHVPQADRLFPDALGVFRSTEGAPR